MQTSCSKCGKPVDFDPRKRGKAYCSVECWEAAKPVRTNSGRPGGPQRGISLKDADYNKLKSLAALRGFTVGGMIKVMLEQYEVKK